MAQTASTICCGNIDHGFESHQCMLIHLHVHGLKRLVIMLATKTKQPERNPLHTGNKACKQGIHLDFEPSADVTKSQKEGYQ